MMIGHSWAAGNNSFKWLLKRTIKAGVHAVVGLMESDSATITVNLGTYAGGR